MKNYQFYFIAFLFTAFSCNLNADNITVIPQNEMADILNDIALAEGFVESFIFKDSSVNKDSVVQAEINKVFQLRKITPEVFSKSYKYYRLHPDEFKVIVDTANTRAIKARDNSYSRRALKSS